MIQFKNPKFLIFLLVSAVLIAISFSYLIDFRIPEEAVPQPRKIQAPGGTISPPTIPPPTTQAEVIKMTVKGDEFSFEPVNITVKRGAKVELTFENIGNAPHNYVVDMLNLKTKTISGGKTDTLIFTAPSSSGSISYASYCSVPGHRESGMEGTIVIE